MPPRRGPEHDALGELPLDLMFLVFLWLPMDQRLLCRAVCRAWRAALTEPQLWRDLDFSVLSRLPNYSRRKATPALLHAASLCARGTVRLIAMPGFEPVGEAPLFEAVVAQARASSETLLTLKLGDNCCFMFKLENLDTLLAAAPSLETLQCSVYCNARLMLRVLSKEAPYTALRVTMAFITPSRAEGGEDLMPLAAAAAAHEGLKRLVFCLPLTVRELDAFADAALARQLLSVQFYSCGLTPAHLPSLARLLSPSLHVFSLECSNEPPFVGDGVPAFCAALRSSSLQNVSLSQLALSYSLPDGIAVLDALTGHRTITDVSIYLLDQTSASMEAQRAVGEALGRLVVAESSLRSLSVSYLGDAGVRPLCESLQQSRSLTSLYLFANDISRECARDFVLPAVRRSHVTLRSIAFGRRDNPELMEVEELVTARQ